MRRWPPAGVVPTLRAKPREEWGTPSWISARSAEVFRFAQDDKIVSSEFRTSHFSGFKCGPQRLKPILWRALWHGSSRALL
jgi:hypothetical protein